MVTSVRCPGGPIARKIKYYPGTIKAQVRDSCPGLGLCGESG